MSQGGQGGYHGETGGNLTNLKKEVKDTTPADIQAENQGTDQAFQQQVMQSYNRQGTFDPTQVEDAANTNDPTQQDSGAPLNEPVTPSGPPPVTSQQLLDAGAAPIIGMSAPLGNDPYTKYKADLALARTQANYWTPAFWESHPELAAHFLISGLPNSDVKRLGMAVDPIQKWAADTHNVGGLSNALTGVYISAVSLPDGYQRKVVINLLDGVKKLSQDDQTLFVNFLLHPENFSGAVTTNRAQATANAASGAGLTTNQSLQNVVGQVIPGATVQNGQLILPSEGRGTADHPFQAITPDQIMVFEHMFPSLKGKIYFNGSSSISTQDWQMSAYNALQQFNPMTLAQRSFHLAYSQYDSNGNKIAGSTLQQIVTEEQKRGMFQSGLDFAGTLGVDALKLGFGGPEAGLFMNAPTLIQGVSVAADQLPFNLGAGIKKVDFGGGLEKLPGALPGAVGRWYRGTSLYQNGLTAGEGAHLGDMAFAKPMQALGMAGAYMTGIKDSPQNPDGTYKDPARHQAYEDAVNRIGGLAFMGILAAYGEYQGGAKTASEGLPSAMAAQMGMADYNPETGRVPIWDSIVKQFGDTSTASKFMHPVDIIGQAFRVMGANHRFVTPEAFFSGGAGDNFLNQTSKIINESGGDAAKAYTDIQRHSPYPLDAGLVHALIQTGGDIEAMRTTAIDFMHGNYKPEGIDTLNSQLDQLNQAHGKLTTVKDQWEQKVYEPGNGTQIPGEPTVPDGFTRVYRAESGQGDPTFWTESLNIARQFARGDSFAGRGTGTSPIHYIDIPTEHLDTLAPEGDPQLAERLITDPQVQSKAQVYETTAPPPPGSNADITGNPADGAQPPLQGPNGATVSLEAGRVDKGGTPIGDIPPSQVEWIRLEDLRTLHETAGYPIIQFRNLDQAEEGKTYTPEQTEAYRKAIADGHFPKPVEIYSNPETGRIRVTDGNHVVQAATEAGSEYIPVIHMNEGDLPPGVADTLQNRVRIIDKFAPQPLTQAFPQYFHAADSIVDTNAPKSLIVDRLATEVRQSILDNGALDPKTIELKRQLRIANADYETYIRAQALSDRVLEQKTLLEQQIAGMDMGVKPTEFRYPGLESLSGKFHQIWNRPTTDAQRWWREVLNPGAKIKEWLNNQYDSLNLNTRAEPWLQRLTDKIEQTPKIYNMTGKDSHANGHDLNAQVITRIGQRYGWSDEDVSRTITEFRTAKTDQDFYDASTNLAKTIDTNLPYDTPQRLRNLLTTFWNRSPEDFKMSHPVFDASGNVVDWEPLLPDANGKSIPSVDPEFINHLTLPNISLIDEVMSATRRWTAKMKSDVLNPATIDSRAQKMVEDGTAVKYGLVDANGEADINQVKQRLYDTNGGGKMGKTAAFTYDLARGMLVWSKALLMPVSLIFHIPGIIFKKSIDEALGNRQYFDIHGNTRPSNTMAAELTTPDPGTIGGSVGTGLLDGMSGDRIVQNVRTEDVIDPTAPNNSHFWRSKISMLDFMSKDPMIRKMIDTGFDANEIKSWLENNPEYKAQLERQLATGNMSLETYLGRLETSIRMETFNDPTMQRYVVDGRIVKPGQGVSSAAANRWDELTSDNKAISERLQSQDLTDAAGRALWDKLTRNKAELADLEKKWEGIDSNGGNLHRGNTKGLTEYLSNRMANGGVDAFDSRYIPDTVRLDRWAADSSGALDAFREAGMRFSQAMYKWFQPIGKVEAGWARGDFYKQAAAKYYRAYSTLEGMDPETAQAFAEARAISETKDVFYGLDARSTMERQLRNVFWYAPLTGEMMYRWLYAIPESRGLAAGMVYNAGTAYSMFQLLKSYHILHQDANGAWVATIPGLQQLVDLVAPHLNVDLKIGSLTHIAPTMPQISPLPAWGLEMTQKHVHNDLLNSIAGQVDKMGASTEFIPTAVKNLLGLAFGVKVVDVNPEADQLRYDVTHDQALQYAFSNMQMNKDTQPNRANFATNEAYTTAWNSWFDRLNNQANHYAKAMQFGSLLQSTVLPSTLSMSSDARDAFTKFWKGTVLPQLVPGQPVPSSVKDSINKWLADHPSSLAFSISYNFYTGKTWQTPPSVLGDKYYQDLYLYGIKGTMDPQKYALYLAAMTAKQSFDAYRNSAIQDVAGSGNIKSQAVNLLTHWGERRIAMQQYQDNWDLYINKLHPDAGHIVDDVTRGLGQFKGYKSESIDQQYISETLTGLSQLSGIFTGTNGLPTIEYKTVVGTIRAAEAKNFAGTGGTDPLSNQLNAYFNTVLTPYMDAVQPLYDKANRARNAQQDSAPFFTSIVAKENQYGAIAKKLGLPSPEQFFFGSKDPKSQELARIGWMTKPTSWLTDFQRQQVGYTPFKGSDKMWNEINTAQQNLYSKINDPSNPISASSNKAKGLKNAEAQQEQDIAKKYGQAGIKALALSNETPAQRIQKYMDNVADNKSWQIVMGAVKQIDEAYSKYNLTVGGNSSYGLQLKEWLYNGIVYYENQDPQFRSIMQDMANSMPGVIPGHPRQGVPLYESLFFGNFSNKYLPASLLNSVQLGKKGI